MGRVPVWLLPTPQNSLRRIGRKVTEDKQETAKAVDLFQQIWANELHAYNYTLSRSYYVKTQNFTFTNNFCYMRMRVQLPWFDIEWCENTCED